QPGFDFLGGVLGQSDDGSVSESAHGAILLLVWGGVHVLLGDADFALQDGAGGWDGVEDALIDVLGGLPLAEGFEDGAGGLAGLGHPKGAGIVDVVKDGVEMQQGIVGLLEHQGGVAKADLGLTAGVLVKQVTGESGGVHLLGAGVILALEKEVAHASEGGSGGSVGGGAVGQLALGGDGLAQDAGVGGILLVNGVGESGVSLVADGGRSVGQVDQVGEIALSLAGILAEESGLARHETCAVGEIALGVGPFVIQLLIIDFGFGVIAQVVIEV